VGLAEEGFGVEFGVLGPLRVVVEGRVVPIASARQRAVLTLLLISANQAVSIHRLIDGVWGEHPAGSVQNMVHTYMWRLRTLLIEQGERRLLTEPAGYRLRVEPGELDLSAFEQLVAGGRAALARGEASRAARSLRTALELWRGEPFADVALHGGDQAAEVQRLTEARVAALQERIEAELALGQHEALIGELGRLAVQHPLRERIAGQLMLACYRSGRQGDALAAFNRIRAALADELGMDPGRELRELHQGILRADPGLVAAAARGSGDRIVPRQLPAAAGHFAGRVREIKALSSLLDQGARSGGTAVISAIDGTAGIGKTTLALNWGHQNLEKFPDGQLYVNLRGFAHDDRPTAPAEAMRGFLDALAVPVGRVPQGLDAQAALYRSLLADKKMLVVLDNARDTDQVRPLLPGSATCMTLVTSRNPLTGLIVTDDARPVTLDLLSTGEAHDLLARRLGTERAAAEAEAIGALIELCARLPLALSIAAARAVVNPALPLSALVAELHHARGRLDALDIGDTTADLRAVFSWSYQHLASPAAHMFRLLGVHPGPDITAAAAASLAGISRDRADRLLGELVGAHLLTRQASGRYACHDLLRAYAAEQAHTVDGPDDRHGAQHRVLDHYLHTARTAAMLIHPNRAPIALDPVEPGVTPEGLADFRQAQSWLEAERPVLLAVIAQAAADGFDTHANLLPWVLVNFFDQRGYWHDYLVTQRSSLIAAQRLGGLAGQARAQRLLGSAHARLGSHEDALNHLQQALDIYRRLDEHSGHAHTRLAIGSLLDQQGRYDEALGHTRQALELYRTAGDRAGQADTLNALGWLHSQLGDHHRAVTYCHQALEMHRDRGDHFGQAHAGDSLGYAYHHLGNHAEALDCYDQALELHQKIGDRYSQAVTLTHIGDTHHTATDKRQAPGAWRQALAILDDLDHPDADKIRAKLRHAESCTTPGCGFEPGSTPEMLESLSG
jgi:DNA-binding SARP family transcriptional activator/tetratricopeptide (TPR) repeat protein